MSPLTAIFIILSTWLIIITSNDDLQPSTVIMNLPSGLVFSYMLSHRLQSESQNKSDTIHHNSHHKLFYTTWSEF